MLAVRGSFLSIRHGNNRKLAYYIQSLLETKLMSRGSVDHNFLFTLGELYRLLRVYADKEASRFGITRAQWAVLSKVERSEGMKQSELAELLEMQPITLTRLIDKLCDNDWIERRSDASDRRVKRLYLKKAGRQLLGRMSGLKSELTANALDGITPADAHRLLTQHETIKENVRTAIQTSGAEQARKEQRYG
jgi:DNA-binding MarR family transcriptional regulator